MVIVNRYMKLYAWMNEAFGDREFTIDEFRIVFPSPQPAKTIYDLIKLNYVKRVRRGRYKVVTPSKFIRKIVEENLKQADILKKAKKKFAFCDDTAVRIWSNGYYWTNFTIGFKPVHLKILKKDLDYWKKFFKENDAEFYLNENKVMFGIMFILHPADKIEIVWKDKIPVVPLKEVINFCEKRTLAYEPVLKYLEKEYGIK